MADNREHFAAASGKMQDFSALQLQTYLKGTKIKRQIDEVMQRADVDDPMTAKRVAARDNRDFIFAGPSCNADPARGTDRLALPAPSGVSKEVATTVTEISSSKDSSTLVPKMMLASS